MLQRAGAKQALLRGWFCKGEARGARNQRGSSSWLSPQPRPSVPSREEASGAAVAGCHQPRPPLSSGAEPAGQQRLAAISPTPQSPQVGRRGPAGLGHRGPQRPPSDQDTAAFMPPGTYAQARGAPAVTYRPLADAHLKGSSPSLWAPPLSTLWGPDFRLSSDGQELNLLRYQTAG